MFTEPNLPWMEETPNENVMPRPRIVVGGEHNRWLNITPTVSVQGAGDPDSKLFMCEVCESTDRENCSISNYTQLTIGSPPTVQDTSGIIMLDLSWYSYALIIHCPCMMCTNNTLLFSIHCYQTLKVLKFNTYNPYADEYCILRDNNGSRLITLECGLLNVPQPQPRRSWFKDGELVYIALSGNTIDTTDFFMEFSILMTGVLDPSAFTATSDGTIFLDYQVENITMPQLLPPNVTIEQARQKVFDLFLGNWTCTISNTLGSATPVTYIIRDCGK